MAGRQGDEVLEREAKKIKLNLELDALKHALERHDRALERHEQLLYKDISSMTGEQQAAHFKQIESSQRYLVYLKGTQQLERTAAATSTGMQDLQRRFNTIEEEENVKLATALVMRPGALQQLQQQQQCDVDSKAKQQQLQAPADPQQRQLGSADEQQQLNESSTAAASDSQGATGKAALGVATWVHPQVAVTVKHILAEYADAKEIIVAVHSPRGMQLQTLQLFHSSDMYDFAVLIWADGEVQHYMPLYEVQSPDKVSIFSGTDNTLVGFQTGVQQDVSELLVEYGLTACNTQVGTMPVHISKVFDKQLIALYTSQTWMGCCGSVIASRGGSAIAIHIAAANSWLANHGTTFQEVSAYLGAASESLSEMKVAVLAEAFKDVVAAAVDHVEKASAHRQAAASAEAAATV